MTVTESMPTVEQRVRAQAAFIASAAFHILLPLVLATLVTASAWTGWVNVMALHTYLDRPGALPGVMWAVPVAVQTFIIAGEATMVLNSILRRRWIMASGATAAAAGYGTETGAHVYYGAAPDTTVTMIVSAIACGGGWALVAALMRRGVELANGDTAAPLPRRRETPPQPGPDWSGPVGPDQSADDAKSIPANPPSGRPGAGEPDDDGRPEEKPPGRRTRAELLEAVRALAPEQPTLTPNFVATRVGISWANAKSLLVDLGRLRPPAPTRQDTPSLAAWSAPRSAWSTPRGNAEPR